MAFTDSVPAVGNQIANDLIAMAADFAWLKTVMSNFVGAWSDSTSTGVFPAKLKVTTLTASLTAMVGSDTIVVLDSTSNAVDYRLTAEASAINRFVFVIASTIANTTKITLSDTTTFHTFGNADEAVILACDGSDWYQIAQYYPSQITAIRDAHRNLIVNNNSTTTVDVTADELILQNSTGLVYRASTVNVTADITASGVDGLDTGSEAPSTWYYIWIIYNGTTVASLLSISSTSPTLPTGYTFYALVGACWNNGSSNLWTFTQYDNCVYYDDPPHNLNGSVTAGAWTSFDMTPYAPATAKKVRVLMGGGSSTNTKLGISLSSDGKKGGSYMVASGAGTAAGFGIYDSNSAYATLTVHYAGTLYYWFDITSGDMYILGWEY